MASYESITGSLRNHGFEKNPLPEPLVHSSDVKEKVQRSSKHP